MSHFVEILKKFLTPLLFETLRKCWAYIASNHNEITTLIRSADYQDGVTQTKTNTPCFHTWLVLLAKPIMVPCLFLIGRVTTHHFLKPIRKQPQPSSKPSWLHLKALYFQKQMGKYLFTRLIYDLCISQIEA